MSLPPDHVYHPNLDLEEIETDLDKCFITAEWRNAKFKVDVTLASDDGKQKKAHKGQTGEIASLALKNRNKKEMKENDGTLACDDDNTNGAHKTIDLAWKKATDWSGNKRVVINEVNDEEREIRNNFVKNELLEVAKNYVKENCNRVGKVKGSNLSEGQENAIKSLKEKRKDGIIVYQTDKTSKFVTDTVENMTKKMQKHIKSDPKIGPKKLPKLKAC